MSAPPSSLNSQNALVATTANPMHRKEDDVEDDAGVGLAADKRHDGEEGDTSAAQHLAPLEVEPDQRPEDPDEDVDKNLADLPYCIGNTIVGITALVLVLVLNLVFFVFQATAVLDEIMDIKDVRRWLGITTRVEVATWVLCLPAAFGALYTLMQLTCRWRQTVRRARAYGEAALAQNKGRFIATAVAFFVFFSGPSSPYFFLLIFASEVPEFIFQCLSLEEMSRAGLSRGALALFTGAIFLNAFATPILTWASSRANRKDARSRKAVGLWVSRVLLLDASIDLAYAAFPIGHLVYRLVYLLTASDCAHEKIVINHSTRLLAQRDNVMVGYMLMSEASACFFGGNTIRAFLVKLFSRTLPLFLAPFRIKLAFAVRRTAWGGVRSPVVVATEAAAAAAASRSNDVIDNDDASDDQEQPSSRRSLRGAGSFVESVQLRILSGAQSAVRRAALRHGAPNHYKAIPLWAAGAVMISNVVFCLTVFGLLATWPPCCGVDPVRDGCAVRAYPIFHVPQSTEEWNQRGCSCNTLFYKDTTCLDPMWSRQNVEGKFNNTIMAQSTTNSKDGITTATNYSSSLSTNHKNAAVGGGDDDASNAWWSWWQEQQADKNKDTTAEATNIKRQGPEVVEKWAASKLLNSSMTLRHTHTLFISACMADHRLLEVISNHAASLKVLQLSSPEYWFPGKSCNPPRCFAAVPTAPWTFPETFGCVGHESAGETWPLMSLQVDGILVSSLPATVVRMTALRELRFQRAGLTALPTTGLGALTNLVELKLGTNNITAIPASIGDLTGLKELSLSFNPVESFNPQSIGRLSNLKAAALNAALPAASTLPPSLCGLSQLTSLSISDNLLPESSLPSCLGALSAIRHLDIANTNLAAVPSFVLELTNLIVLNLDRNDFSAAGRGGIPRTGRIARLTALAVLHMSSCRLSSLPEGLAQLTALEKLYAGANRITSVPASFVQSLLSDEHDRSIRVDLADNNITAKSLAETLTVANVAASPAATTASPPRGLLIFSNNTACAIDHDDHQMTTPVPSRAGPWQIKCNPECAPTCQSTGVGSITSQLLDGLANCAAGCNNAACNFDNCACTFSAQCKIPANVSKDGKDSNLMNCAEVQNGVAVLTRRGTCA